MFSVIICSVDNARFAVVKAMYERAFHGSDWELIRIDDARSLTDGYTRGLAISKGDKLIFSHDDIDIFSPDIPQRLERHLAEFDVIGVAGTTLLQHVTWYGSGHPHIFGQVVHPAENNKLMVSIFNTPFPVVRDIQAIDGLFMAARRSVFSRISFDTVTFDGFHFYDLDFSYAAFRAGLSLAVVNDICIFHASAGDYGEIWKQYAKKFNDKWFNGATPPPQRRCGSSIVVVDNREEALEVMTPPYWRQICGNSTPIVR